MGPAQIGPAQQPNARFQLRCIGGLSWALGSTQQAIINLVRGRRITLCREGSASGSPDVISVVCPRASRKHCIFIEEGGVWCVRDNNSTNGTIVDGALIKAGEPVELRVGSKIKLNESELCFQFEKMGSSGNRKQTKAAVKAVTAVPMQGCVMGNGVVTATQLPTGFMMPQGNSAAGSPVENVSAGATQEKSPAGGRAGGEPVRALHAPNGFVAKAEASVSESSLVVPKPQVASTASSSCAIVPHSMMTVPVPARSVMMGSGFSVAGTEERRITIVEQSSLEPLGFVFCSDAKTLPAVRELIEAELDEVLSLYFPSGFLFLLDEAPVQRRQEARFVLRQLLPAPSQGSFTAVRNKERLVLRAAWPASDVAQRAMTSSINTAQNGALPSPADKSEAALAPSTEPLGAEAVKSMIESTLKEKEILEDARSGATSPSKAAGELEEKAVQVDAEGTSAEEPSSGGESMLRLQNSKEPKSPSAEKKRSSEEIESEPLLGGDLAETETRGSRKKLDTGFKTRGAHATGPRQTWAEAPGWALCMDSSKASAQDPTAPAPAAGLDPSLGHTGQQKVIEVE